MKIFETFNWKNLRKKVSDLSKYGPLKAFFLHCCWSLRKWLPYIVSRMSDTIRFSHHSKPKNTFLEIFFIHSKSKRKHLVHFIFSKHLLCWKWQFSCRRTTILDKCNRFGKFRDKESQPNIRTNTYCNERERELEWKEGNYPREVESVLILSLRC